MSEQIQNKVKSNTKLVTIDLARLFHDPSPVKELDISRFLHMGLMLKERDFRDQLASFDWSQFQDSCLAVFCSTDAIIAPWAWMLVSSYAGKYAKEVFQMGKMSVVHELYQRNLRQHNWEQYRDKFVLLKGCGDIHVPDSIYVQATNYLTRVSKKIMYGEACSFVPVWKQEN